MVRAKSSSMFADCPAFSSPICLRISPHASPYLRGTPRGSGTTFIAQLKPPNDSSLKRPHSQTWARVARAHAWRAIERLLRADRQARYLGDGHLELVAPLRHGPSAATAASATRGAGCTSGGCCGRNGGASGGRVGGPEERTLLRLAVGRLRHWRGRNLPGQPVHGRGGGRRGFDGGDGRGGHSRRGGSGGGGDCLRWRLAAKVRLFREETEIPARHATCVGHAAARHETLQAARGYVRVFGRLND